MQARRLYVLLLAPTLCFIVVFRLIPLFYTMGLSFYSWTMTKPSPPEFVGAENYFQLLADPGFSRSMETTFAFTLVAVAAELILGLGIALLLNRPIKGLSAIRTAITLPCVLTPAVVGTLWRMIYHPEFGLANYISSVLGGEKIYWLSSPSLALISLIIVDVWEWTPWMVLVLYAGLVALPIEPFEAARIDGASAWRTLTLVTLPMLSPAVLVALLIRSMDAFRTLDTVFVLTEGGPGDATNLISFLTYRVAFRFYHMGYAAAMIGAVLLFVLGMSLVYIRSIKT